MNLAFPLLLLFLSASSFADQDILLLSRPLIADRPQNVARDDDADDLLIRCTSWRVAGEANNLAPWQTVPQECGSYVREYMTGKGYRYDLEIAAREAAAFARSVLLAGDGKDAWVFDVDETLLSNLQYYADHGFGLELFNGHEFDKWVEKAVAPAIQSSLQLYHQVLDLGFKAILLTGRSEAHRDITIDNLISVGFRDWEKLILRGPSDRGKSAKVYKSERRSVIVADGYRIHGNSGDQWSDLVGSEIGHRSFKLPNPMDPDIFIIEETMKGCIEILLRLVFRVSKCVRLLYCLLQRISGSHRCGHAELLRYKVPECLDLRLKPVNLINKVNPPAAHEMDVVDAKVWVSKLG